MPAPPFPRTLTLALCQLNPCVGDLAGNAAKAMAAYDEAVTRGADLVVFPELFLTGYPPEDLLLLPSFLEATRAEAERVIAHTAGKPAAMLLGVPWPGEDGLANAALLIEDGAIRHVARKHHLPNAGVFDEKRVFVAGPPPQGFAWRGRRIGVLICEDMWHGAPFARLKAEGAELAIVINGSPFEEAKQASREAIVGEAARAHALPVAYLNMVGGQDELVFDGNSFAADAAGEVVHRSPAFREEVAILTLGGDGVTAPAAPEPILAVIPAIYHAAMLGLRDYVAKNGVAQVLLGLSGGIDSALVAALAVDALGAEAVRSVMLPYRYTSAISVEDAAGIARRLGIAHDVLPIEAGVEGVREMLAPLAAAGVPNEVAMENLQSRLRGVSLMAISNSTGAFLLSTGNKSELAMGYATLYGDMCGAFNPLKDIYKTQVFDLARWRNAHRPVEARGPEGEVIPERVITRPPSAELREGQTDQDSLPPYDRLDAMLRMLIEGRASVAQLVAHGFPETEAKRVAWLFQLNEYKRFQSPPGPKVSRMNLGRDRRYPLTNRFRLS